MPKTLERKSTRLRHTPKRLRPHCAAIRADLDPWFYPTLEAFEDAIASGTLHREYGCRNKAESEAAAKDSLI